MQAVRGGKHNKLSQKCREEMVNSGAKVMLGHNCPGKLMCKSWRWHKKNANNLNVTKLHIPTAFKFPALSAPNSNILHKNFFTADISWTHSCLWRIANTDIRFIRSLMWVTASDRLKSEESVETYNKLKNIMCNNTAI